MDVHEKIVSDLDTLIVRLKTADKKIQFLEKNSNQAQADEVRNEIKRQNNNIKESFQKHYTVGILFFIDPNQAQDLFNRNYKKVDLIDISGHPVETKLSNNSNYIFTKIEAGRQQEHFVLMDKDKNILPYPIGNIFSKGDNIDTYELAIINLTEALAVYKNRYERAKIKGPIE